MGYLNTLLDNFLNMQVDQIIETSVKLVEGGLEDAQVDQMMRGEGADGEPIGIYQDPNYAAMKERMNPRAGGYVDGRYTGEMHQGVYVTIEGDDLKFASTGRNYKDFTAKFPNAWGLNAVSISQVTRDELTPEIKNKIEAATGLKFGQ